MAVFTNDTMYTQPTLTTDGHSRPTVGRQVFWGALLHNYPYSNVIFKSRCEVCNKEDNGSENEQNQGTDISINLLVFLFPF